MLDIDLNIILFELCKMLKSLDAVKTFCSIAHHAWDSNIIILMI